ncbi:glycosyl transferase family 1 [Desulfonema ishimotonii]|uniref:sucrose-phosphate synthase n=1 Tax=Desulfonema ishimotonii TaxID=45657 RepID=A0A401FV20_9BACT|nr:HAD-IIB family hydrolase [Desulfonema ishimotonii]GBC60798.1 glycosyl transferase family 1 [Desulfonema ishimotonii]
MKDSMYFQMFSIHGLLRYDNMELGRDADTGGQIKYVVEMAETLSKHEKVGRVDLFTRLISDKRVSEDYSQAVDEISDKFRIVRIQCGGKRYIRKELLWPHLDEYIDKTIKFIRREGVYPDIIHGHYPDAGYVGIRLSEYFATPFIYTGHSMGRAKKRRLLGENMKAEEINKKFHIEQRIATEEEIIRNADLIITSTRQEIDEQYGMYRNRDLAKYCVIPPGLSLDNFYPYYRDMLPANYKEDESILAYGSVKEELRRFFKNPEKPLILALCRADKRKNISGMIDAYGNDRELQAIANLAIFAGLRKNIRDMEENEKEVLTEMLLSMDKYDLYGKMAIPKKHDFTYEVPELYRIVAEKKGVFVNAALTEPFGLTLIEASACGVPLIATSDGGPRDIIQNCQNGILVDPTDTPAISEAVKTILVDSEKWKTFSSNGIRGVREHYSWDTHIGTYLNEMKSFANVGGEAIYKKSGSNPVGDRLIRLDAFLITDIDNTLLGDEAALKRLMQIIRENKEHIGFGVATGRTVGSTIRIFEKYGLIVPDVIISSVGSEMYYRWESFPDKGWQAHISKRWNRDRIMNLLDEFDFLEYQEAETQRPCKISYYMAPEKDRLPMLYEKLIANKCHCTIIYSHDQFLDILPYRASKGKAVRYLSYKWEIPAENIMVCGDSGNDKEMLKGNTMGVVVGNYTPELEKLRGRRKIYFSSEKNAGGIIDGLVHYGLIDASAGLSN